MVDDRAKADIFNHYFHSVYTREVMFSFDTLKDSTDFHSPIITTVDFPLLLCIPTYSPLMHSRLVAQILLQLFYSNTLLTLFPIH